MPTKVDVWPTVVPNDYGIRPAGPPDACFYCKSQVGEEHKRDCVTIDQLVEYNVTVVGSKVGTFTRYESHAWSPQDCEFHKNQSSWCKDNALNGIQWTDLDARRALRREMKSKKCCSCGLIHFEFNRVVDPGPFVSDPHDD